MNHIFVAGTFDGLHAGHRRLLTEAFRVGERVTIGVTSDEFVARFKSQIPSTKFQTNPKHQIPASPAGRSNNIKSYKVRLGQLMLWLRKQSYFDRGTIIPISDPHEPAASMPDLDALIVTRENRATGERINALRQGLVLSALTLVEVPIVAAEDGNAISSTRLRNGEIDPDGRLVMPESMRAALGKPLGTVLEGIAITASIATNSKHVIITVGDMATKTVLDAGITPYLAIIDGKVGRKPFPETLKTLQLQRVKPCRFKTVKSGPGFISREAVAAIRAILATQARPATQARGHAHQALIVDGEEDLLVLPVIEYAPLGSILYYGQPGKGLVEVVVTEEKKKQVVAIIDQFLS